MKLCSLASGSSGNCMYVESQGTKLLIDSGLSGKTVTKALDTIGAIGNEIDGILVTHDHSDHIKGVGILSRKYNIPIYANAATWEEIKDKIGKVEEKNIKYFENQHPFEIKDFFVEPFSIPHDACDPVGFSLYGNSKKMSIATDLGYIDQSILEKIYGADMLVLEANHDVNMLEVGSYPYFLKRRVLSDEGHLSNESAGNALVKLVEMGLNRVLLAHLSRENNFPELAYQTVYNILYENEMIAGQDILVDVAQREKMTSIYCL